MIDQETEKINQDMGRLQKLQINVNEESKKTIGKQREETNKYLKQVLLEYTNAIEEKIGSSGEIHDEIFRRTRVLSDEVDGLLKEKQNEWEKTFEIMLQERLELFLKEIESKKGSLERFADSSKRELTVLSAEMKESFQDKFELFLKELYSQEASFKKLAETYEGDLHEKFKVFTQERQSFLKETDSKEELFKEMLEASKSKIDSLSPAAG